MFRVIFFFLIFVLIIDTETIFAQSAERPLRYNYTRREDSRPGDYKVVTVPVTNPRQAKLDAQTYHVGWDAVDAWMGQSRVMYNVLLKKRRPYIPGSPPTYRPIPKDQQ